jgi:starch synthase
MQIVFLCSEYEGLLKTGGLADATRGLAQALKAQGHQITVLLPRYGGLYQRELQSEWQSVYFELGGQHYGCAVRHLIEDGIAVTLIEHHDFFARSRPYDDGYYPYADNALRFAFFCKAALCYLSQSGIEADVIHGHDWQTALSAVYLKQMQQQGLLTKSRFVLTIHNAAYQQGISAQDLATLGLSAQDLATDVSPSLLSLGVQHASALNTVSQGYRDELLSEPAANGLSALYQARQDSFVGILNGCDYGRWDPQTDKSLIANYHSADLTGKSQCKTELRRQMGLADNHAGQHVPLFVLVSRVTGQKGFDYLIPALSNWLGNTDAQVVMMGTGEQKYIQPLKALQQQFPLQYRFIEGFDEDFSHQLEAAGDFFLMPSLFEPCGLNQIYSLRYGTVPIVRATGGLKDTVVALPARGANGISFVDPDETALVNALITAEMLFKDRQKYKKVQQRGMQQYFGWEQAATAYLQLYQQAL